MYKVILLIKKRPDLTREQFIDYYDNKHIPFMKRTLSVGAAVHRRNFVIPSAHQGNEPDENYDVICEVMYEDLETARASLKDFEDEDIRRRIKEDEANFILPGSVKRFIVEVHETVHRPLS